MSLTFPQEICIRPLSNCYHQNNNSW